MSSLGEVHSVALCVIRGCSIFLSDDGDSKQLKRIVEKYYLGNLNVYNRKELIESLSNPQILSRHDRKAFSHGLS
jgi:hypothetical protein